MCDWLRRLFAGRRVCTGREALQLMMRSDTELYALAQTAVAGAIRAVVKGRKVQAGLIEQQADMASRMIVLDLLDALHATIRRVEEDGLTQKGGR